MKMQRISIFIINLMVLMVLPLTSFSQETLDPLEEHTRDTIIVKQKYGLRLGGDIGKLIRTFIDDDYKGFQISGDYRLTKRLYLAGELGTEDRTHKTDYLNVTTSGSYFKAGIDYNLYTNWLDMENLIYTGLRAGASTFNHTLNQYTVYTTDQYHPHFSSSEAKEFNRLSAVWTELVIGVKAEILTNLFLGFDTQLKILITDDQPSNFENLFIPGFNRTFDSGRFGFGFNYNMTYLIPVFKKNKKIPVEE